MGLQVCVVESYIDRPDKGLEDWVFDKELMKPLAGINTAERNFREEAFSTGKKKFGGDQGTFFEQTTVLSNCLDNAVDDVLRDHQ